MDNRAYAQTGLQTTDALFDMLHSQAEAIWPQEKEIILKHCGGGSLQNLKILDVGCGCGEACFRLSELFPNAIIVGTDLVESNVQFCKQRQSHLLTSLGGRAPPSLAQMSFRVGNAYELCAPGSGFADNSFNLVTCSSMLHCIREPDQVVRNLLKLTCKGGLLHLLNEDYGMIFSYPYNSQRLWDATVDYFTNTGSNGLLGRASFSLVNQEAAHLQKRLQKISTEPILVDTLRVSRSNVSKILTTWRNGYSEATAAQSGGKYNGQEIFTMYDEILRRCVHDESAGYFCWQLISCDVLVGQ